MAVAGIFLGTVLVKQLYEKRCGRPPRPPIKWAKVDPKCCLTERTANAKLILLLYLPG